MQNTADQPPQPALPLYQRLKALTPLEIIQLNADCETRIRQDPTNRLALRRENLRRQHCCEALIEKAVTEPHTLRQIQATYCNHAWTYAWTKPATWQNIASHTYTLRLVMPVSNTADPHTCYLTAVEANQPQCGQPALTLAKQLANTLWSKICHVWHLPDLHTDVQQTIACTYLRLHKATGVKATLVVQLMHTAEKIQDEVATFDRLTADLALIRRYQ